MFTQFIIKDYYKNAHTGETQDAELLELTENTIILCDSVESMRKLTDVFFNYMQLTDDWKENSNVSAIFEDPEGHIWMTSLNSERAILCLLDDNNNTIQTIRITTTPYAIKYMKSLDDLWFNRDGYIYAYSYFKNTDEMFEDGGTEKVCNAVIDGRFGEFDECINVKKEIDKIWNVLPKDYIKLKMEEYNDYL